MPISSHYRSPLIVFAVCAVVAIAAAQGAFGQINNFPLIFALICLLTGLKDVWSMRPRLAVPQRITILLLAALLPVGGWSVHQDKVSKSLSARELERSALIVGTLAPPISGLEALNVSQAALDLATQTTGQVTIATFWARWCSPCWKEMRELEELYQEHAGAGLNLIAVTRFDSPDSPSKRKSDTAKAKTFLQKRKFSYPAGMSTTPDLYPAFQVRSIPTTVLIDQQGTVVDYALGLDSSRRLMVRAVDLLASD